MFFTVFEYFLSFANDSVSDIVLSLINNSTYAVHIPQNNLHLEQFVRSLFSGTPKLMRFETPILIVIGLLYVVAYQHALFLKS